MRWIKNWLRDRGQRVGHYTYTYMGSNFESLGEKMDLGVVMRISAQPSRQCAEAAKRSNRILGKIKRKAVSGDQGVVQYSQIMSPYWTSRRSNC